jgi:hypothetical protein
MENASTGDGNAVRLSSLEKHFLCSNYLFINNKTNKNKAAWHPSVGANPATPAG